MYRTPQPNPSPTAPTRMAATTPQDDLDAPVVAPQEDFFEPKYEEPLYTEINIPLPALPSLNPESSASSTISSPPQQQKSRGRSRTLSSLSPFHRSRSASNASPPSRTKESGATARDEEEWPRIRKDIVKSREVHAVMDLRQQNRRNRSKTLDALAVVPAVLVLSAELFTPGSGDESTAGGKRKDSGVGRWEDGIR